jgi:hypothetical protein
MAIWISVRTVAIGASTGLRLDERIRNSVHASGASGASGANSASAR